MAGTRAPDLNSRQRAYLLANFEIDQALEGSAPGMDALTPRWSFGAEPIGYARQTRLYTGHNVTFKNG